MSIHFMNMAWSLDLSPTQKLVFLAIADRANDDGVCWPGQASLANKCGVTDRTIRTVIEQLKELGLLDVEYRQGEGLGRKTNVYTIRQPEEFSGIGNRKSETGNRKSTAGNRKPTSYNTLEETSVKTSDNMFDYFWKNYPRKQDRKKAEKAFSRIPEKNKQKAIDDCKIRYADTPAQYIPLPTTYLNGERWNDEIIKTDKQKPEWATLPRANDELWPFAKKNGYSAPGSKTYDQYRQSLTIEIERRLHKEGIFV